MSWKDLEPAKGVWNFSRLDALVALAQQHNVDVILPLALTPQWASERPNEPSAYTSGAAAPPANIDDWIEYVQTVTGRYKGKIAYYEIGNEMNCPSTWTGTAAEIVSLQEAAYATIKSVDSDAKLISANLQKWLVGNVLGPCGDDRAGTWSCNLQFSDGRKGVILWNPAGSTTISPNLSWTPSEVEDMYGHCAPASGTRLSVDEKPVLLRE